MNWGIPEINTLSEALVKIAFFALFLGFKYKSKVLNFIILSAGVAGQFALVTWLISEDNLLSDIPNFDGAWAPIIYISYSFLFSLLFLKGKTILKLATSCIVEMAMASISLGILSIIGLISSAPIIELIGDEGELRIAVMVTARIVQIITVIVTILIHKKILHQPGKNELHYIIQICSLSALVTLFVGSQSLQSAMMTEQPDYLTMVITFTIIALANIVILRLVAVFSQKDRESKEAEKLKLESALQKQNVNHIVEQQNQLSYLHHDFNNYLHTIYNLIQDNASVAGKYVSDIINTKLPTLHKYITCDNAVIEVIINRKLMDCEQEGIGWDCNINTSFINNQEEELGTVLFNLLDNAILAAKTSKHPKINISAYDDNSFQYIVIENSIAESVLDNNPKMKTTKRKTSKNDSVKHGKGVQNVKSLLKDMDGKLTFMENEKKDMFITEIELPLNSSLLYVSE